MLATLLLVLQLGGGALNFVHDTKQVAAPKFFDLRFAVASANKLDGDVQRLAGVVPADDAAAAVEVGREADVIDTDEFDGIVNVVDEISQIRRTVAWVLFV